MKFQKKILTIATLALLSLGAHAKVTNGKTYGDWKGFCGKDICVVEQEASNEKGKPIAAVALRKDQNGVVGLIISLPLGVFLAPGVEVSIDGQKLGSVPFAFCSPDSCNVIPIPLKDDVLNKIKKGNTLKVSAALGNQKRDLNFSLKGVTAAINAL